MKVQTINGVPYLINEASVPHEVFVYSSVPPISVGTYSPDTKVISLHADWEERMESWMKHYRENLKESTQEALTKAKALQASS
jgi:hypothetical protein